MGAPGRVVGAGVGQQHGHIARRRQRADQLGGLFGEAGQDDGPAAEPGLAQQLGNAVLGAGVAQGAEAGRGQRGGDPGQPVALAVFAEVDAEGAVPQPGGEPGDEVGVVGVVGGQHVRHGQEVAVQGGVRRVVAEEVGEEPVGYAQRAGQEGAFGLLDVQQAERAQGCAGVEAGACRREVGGRPAQFQGESDGGPASADVVVEIAVERLEAPVEVGGERDEEDRRVEGVRVSRAARRSSGSPSAGAGTVSAGAGAGGSAVSRCRTASSER